MKIRDIKYKIAIRIKKKFLDLNFSFSYIFLLVFNLLFFQIGDMK